MVSMRQNGYDLLWVLWVIYQCFWVFVRACSQIVIPLDHPTTPDDSDTFHEDQELGGNNLIHPIDSAGQHQAERTHFVAEMVTNPNGWGVGWKPSTQGVLGLGTRRGSGWLLLGIMGEDSNDILDPKYNNNTD